MIYVREDLKPLFPEDSVAEFMKIEGETVKHVVEDRHTFRFERGGKLFYMKAHFGVGWKEIFKNLVTLKAPVLGAKNEWQAIRAFEQLGVPTMRIAAYGKIGWNPARRHSFLITDALEKTEDLEQWLPTLDMKQPEDVRLKRAIISRLGQIARTLHQSGLNHRDFYLCHFRLDLLNGKPDTGSVRLYVMDLHRVMQHNTLPKRWQIKDLAALLYSSLHSCSQRSITVRDLLRFVAEYRGQTWRQSLKQDRKLWQAVLRRSVQLSKRGRIAYPHLPAALQEYMGSHD